METIEPAYVLDTHTLIWYLAEKDKLSPEAERIFEIAERGETQLLISAIVVAELYHIGKKKLGLFDDFSRFYSELKQQPYFQFVPFMPDDVLRFERDEAVPEIHDRIIAGLARQLGVPLLTKDEEIVEAKLVRIIFSRKKVR